MKKDSSVRSDGVRPVRWAAYSARFGIAIAVALLACASRPGPVARVVRSEVHSWVDVELAVSRVAGPRKRSEILVVADIDRTVMRPVRYAGSEDWYEWQAGISSAKRASCLFTALGILLDLSRMETVEEDVAPVIARLRRAGHPVLFLTARNPSFRWATERELRRLLLLDDAASPEGLARAGWPWLRSVPGLDRSISVSSGVAMVAGQDKGIVLRWILEELELKPAAIVVIDDKPVNNDAIAAALRGYQGEIWLFDYRTAARRDVETGRRLWIEHWPQAFGHLRALTAATADEATPPDCPNDPQE